MSQDNVFAFNKPEAIEDPLTALPRTGAKRLIQQAVEVELSELLLGLRLTRRAALLRRQSYRMISKYTLHRLVSRHAKCPPPTELKQSAFRDRDGGDWEVFEDVDTRISHIRELVCRKHVPRGKWRIDGEGDCPKALSPSEYRIRFGLL